MTYNPQANPNNIYKFGKTRFTFLTDRMIRIEWNEKSLFTDEATFAAVNRYSDDIAVETTENNQRFCLKTKYLELHYNDEIGKLNYDSLLIHYKNGENKETWHYGDTDSKNLGGTLRTLDRMKGSKKHIQNSERDVIGWEENSPDNGLISRSGYAVFDDSDNVCFKKNEGYFRYWPEARQEGNVDIYFIAYGNDFKTALSDASNFFGSMPLPPRFALGYWYSRYFPFTDDDIRDLISTTRTLKMPMDVMVIDMEWHKPGWTGYSWDKSYFPAPEKLLEWLKNQNIKVTLNLHPAAGVAAHEDGYTEFAKAMGIDPESKKTIPFDSTNTKYMENYFKILHQPLEDKGVNFWWMDWQQGQACSIRNLDPLMMLNKLHYEDMEKTAPEKRPLIFSRYCGLGSGRYPIGFSGDTYICWESLAFQPGLTAGSANILFGYWSHDIGGHYRGDLTPELFMRWIQFGLYSPILRVHSGNDRRLWEQESPYRWMMIELLKKRYELIPYIYTEMLRGNKTGLALCHPLYYDYPEKEKAYENSGQYMFGEKMLIAPITAPADPESQMAEKKVWLPEGTWFDTANGTIVEGESDYSADFTMNQTPVFVKTGTIIPGLSGAQHLDFKSYDNILITCYRGGTGHYKLYEDDGATIAYQKKYFVTLDISQCEDGNNRLINIDPCEGSYDGYKSHKQIKLSLPLTPYPTAIYINDTKVELSQAVNYEAKSLTTVISAGNLDLNKHNKIKIEFPEHDPSIFYGIPGELAKLLTLKEDIRALGRSGKVILNVNEDRFYFELIGIIERLSYFPQTIISELEKFEENKAKSLHLAQKYLDVAKEILDFSKIEEDPEKIRNKFETICFNKPVERVIQWAENAVVALPKLIAMLNNNKNVVS